MNNKQLIKFLFPVIYGNDNVSVSKQCVEIMLTKDDDMIWELLKYGLLRKTLDWKYQNEWRLISFDTLLADAGNYNCLFYPITKVYLGNCMEEEQRAKIIGLCKKKRIPYVMKYMYSNK